MPVGARACVVAPGTAGCIGRSGLAVGQGRQRLAARIRIVCIHVVELHIHVSHYQRTSSRVPKSGRSLSAIASRARKIRERTVPIGQFITAAISS